MGRDKILYYVVGPVHPRNLRLIADGMPDRDFCMIYEPQPWWKEADVLTDFPYEHLTFIDDRVPEGLVAEDFAAVVFSTVQPRPAPIRLLAWTLDHGIPSIGIEESNQISANSGATNNYLLPLDHLLVASPAEARGFVQAGLPARDVHVTGWPFYAGHADLEPGARRAAKERLGLDPARPVAALALTGFNDTAGETSAVRRQLLTMAAQGLPQDYQLLIKPHPIEKPETLMPFLRECAPLAIAVEGLLDITAVLNVTDVLLNRGVSQVAIEALARKIPVVVLATGKETPFHQEAPAVVAERAADVREIIALLDSAEDPMALYASYKEQHMPFDFARARDLACAKVNGIANERVCAPEVAAQWFRLALYGAWKSDREEARAWIERARAGIGREACDALDRLIRCRASRADLGELATWFGRPYEQDVLRCLWIEQLAGGGIETTAADLDWLGEFPQPVNVTMFAGHCSLWARQLIRAGHRDAFRAFVARLRKDWGLIPEYAQVIEHAELWDKGIWGLGVLAVRRGKMKAKALAKVILRR